MATSIYPSLSTIEGFLNQNFDFIIIGGGTSGLVVAARLAENPNVHVGVLEAGPAHFGDPLITIPALYPQAIGNPEYDWLHKSVPQKAMNGRVYDQPRGKGLGGSSAINYQMYIRGQASDYDDWAKLGNEGWDFKALLPYFKKHEHFDDPAGYSSKNNIPLETKFDPKYHGHDGPIHTSFSTWRLPLEKEWVAASSVIGKRMGSPIDAWSGDHIGTFHSLSSIERSIGPGDGSRSYSVTGYLLPNASRPNLHVLTDALVSKIVVSGDGSATGVEFIYAEKLHTITAKKEIVLSAGTFKSPQILELSGIGNPAILSKAGVQCLVENLRVGENFQDHPATGIGLELVDGEQSMDMFQDPAVLQKAMVEYMTHKTGPLSSGGSAMGFAAYADLATSEEIKAVQNSILESPDASSGGHTSAAKKLIAEGLGNAEDGSIQLALLPASLDPENIHSQTALLAGPASQKGKQGISFVACVARPVSIGSVHITSNNPFDDPAIDPAYLTHEADVEVAAKGMQLILKVIATSPFKEKIKKRYYPDEALNLGDEEVLKKYIRHHTTTEYHPLGSVSMGKPGQAACDDRLRVHGVKGIRVIDASVIPLQVSGNIQSAVYAVAEKGADLIKEDWGL